MRHATACTLFVVLLAGCEEAEPEPEPRTEAEAEGEAEGLARTKAAAKQLGGTLKKRLLSAMKQGGPKGAIEMCSTEAQDLSDGVAEETGVRVGRSSLRLRNPDNAGPPWVTSWLEEQGERKAEGARGLARVVGTDDGREARVLEPIAMEGPCMSCHGPKDQLAEGVQPVLEEQYPKDEATGYGLGDLRGALWAASTLD